MAKQIEYYHTQALNLCAGPAASCPAGQIALTQLAGDSWVYGTDVISSTDGTHIVTTWHLRPQEAAVDARHLYGNIGAVLVSDTENSGMAGTYSAATHSVASGAGSSATANAGQMSFTIASPFAGLVINDGAPVLVSLVR